MALPAVETPPTLAQPSVEGDTAIVAIPQLSEEPLSICAAVIVAAPVAFRLTVRFCVATTGSIMSTPAGTVTDCAVEVQPRASFTFAVIAPAARLRKVLDA